MSIGAGEDGTGTVGRLVGIKCLLTSKGLIIKTTLHAEQGSMCREKDSYFLRGRGGV
tara:strand:- start:527 stop:697 length:171 start_codon:yes stop_codon:yes gene_type:complete